MFERCKCMCVLMLTEPEFGWHPLSPSTYAEARSLIKTQSLPIQWV